MPDKNADVTPQRTMSFGPIRRLNLYSITGCAHWRNKLSRHFDWHRTFFMFCQYVNWIWLSVWFVLRSWLCVWMFGKWWQFFFPFIIPPPQNVYTPTTKCGGGGYTGFALSRRSVGRSVGPSVRLQFLSAL